MPATGGYAAGLPVDGTQWSYGIETEWGILPVTQFRELRSTSSGMRGSKTRQRPNEIRRGRDSTAAITTQETAGGPLAFALSYGTYDDLLASVLGNDWSPTLTIAGVAGDISAIAAGNRITSTTVGKFTDVRVGQWIRTLGFSTPGNNALLYVAAKPDNLTLSVTGAVLANETPAGAAAQIRGSQVANGAMFQSLSLQHQVGPSLYFRYPGTYPSAFTLTGGVGQFLSGSFTLASKREISATENASTGPIVPAPAGRVHDSVGAFRGIYLDGVKFPADVSSFTINISNEGAAPQYAMGDSAAVGMLPGTHLGSGQIETYFSDLALYQRFLSEALGSVAFATGDPDGNTYVITLPAATIMNPDRTVSGPGTAIMSRFELEGGPHPTLGSTVTIDRLPAV